MTAALIAFWWQIPSKSDSWQKPHEFDTPSENGKFVARVIPASKAAKAILVVLAIESGKNNEVWRTQLSNEVAPTQVLLTNDGESVLTLDNWFGVGYGDDVVAIYNRHGQLAKYSLDQIATPGREQLFTTTSSRHWRANGIELSVADGEDAHYAVWLDWANQWVAWRLRDGQPIKVTGEVGKQFIKEARNTAITSIKNPSSQDEWGFGMNRSQAAARFLARLRFAEDRPLVASFLQASDFRGGIVKSFSGGVRPVLSFLASSSKRAEADRLLTRWDGKRASNMNFDQPGHGYRFLGVLEGAIAFNAPPDTMKGSIRLYLIPESVPLNEWDSKLPTQFLIVDCNDKYSSGNGAVLEQTVGFVIEGVTPGEYRIKAVWDKAAPFSKENEILCQPGPGDYESTSSPIVTVRAGKTSKDVQIDCKTLVK